MFNIDSAWCPAAALVAVLLLLLVSMVFTMSRTSSTTSLINSPATRKAARKPRQGSSLRKQLESVAQLFTVILKRNPSTNRSRNSRRRAAAKARKGSGAQRVILFAAAVFQSFSAWTGHVSIYSWTRFTDAANSWCAAVAAAARSCGAVFKPLPAWGRRISEDIWALLKRSARRYANSVVVLAVLAAVTPIAYGAVMLLSVFYPVWVLVKFASVAIDWTALCCLLRSITRTPLLPLTFPGTARNSTGVESHHFVANCTHGGKSEGSVTEATSRSTRCADIVPWINSNFKDDACVAGTSTTEPGPRQDTRTPRAPPVAINNAATSTAIVLYAAPSPVTCTDIALYSGMADPSTTTRSKQLRRRTEGSQHALTANSNDEKDTGASQTSCRAITCYTGLYYAHLSLVLFFDAPGDLTKNVDDKEEGAGDAASADRSRQCSSPTADMVPRSCSPHHSILSNNGEKGLAVLVAASTAIVPYTGHHYAHMDFVFRRGGSTGALGNMDDKDREIQRLKAELDVERRGRRSVESELRVMRSSQSELKAKKAKTDTQTCVVIAVLCALVMTLVKKAKSDRDAMLKKVKLALNLCNFHKARLQHDVSVWVKTAHEQRSIAAEKDALIDRLNRDVDAWMTTADEQRSLVVEKNARIKALNREVRVANGRSCDLTRDNLALCVENHRLGQANRRLGQANNLLTGLSRMMRLQALQTSATALHYNNEMVVEVEHWKRVASIESTAAQEMKAMAEDATDKLKASQLQVQELQQKGHDGGQSVTKANQKIAQLQAIVYKSAEDLVEARRTIAELEQQLGAQQQKTARWKGAAYHEYKRVEVVEDEVKAKLKALRTAVVDYMEVQGAEGVAPHILEQRMAELATQLGLSEIEMKSDFVRGCALYDPEGMVCSGWIPHWSLAVPVTVTDEEADELADAGVELELCTNETIAFKTIRQEVEKQRKKAYRAAIDTSKGRSP